MLRDGLATTLQRRPWCLWQDYWPWRNRGTSAAQEAEWGDLNLLGIKMTGGDFPRNPKFLFSNWIWMGSSPLQGDFKTSDPSFLKRERFSILSHMATAQGAQTREESSVQLHFFYPRNDYIVQRECEDPGSFWALHIFWSWFLSCLICPDFLVPVTVLSYCCWWTLALTGILVDMLFIGGIWEVFQYWSARRKAGAVLFCFSIPFYLFCLPLPLLWAVSLAAVLVLAVALCPLFHVETWSSQAPASCWDGICIPLLINVFFFCTCY